MHGNGTARRGRGGLDSADLVERELRRTHYEPGGDPRSEALGLAVAANLPVLLWGEPGIGKTAVLTQLADGFGLPMETVVASVHEPSDFAGLPIIGPDAGRAGVAMAPPDWAVRLADAGTGLVFLDELSSAPPAVQAALLRVVLERRVGSLQLPEGVRVVAAANPPSSAADGWNLAAPLANRFVHLHWRHDPQVVTRGLAGTWPLVPVPVVDPGRVPTSVTRARGVVSGFLSARPGLVHRMPDETDDRGGAWPSPRTWEMAVRLLALAWAADAGRDAVAAALAGAVGDGPAIELCTFVDDLDLPDPDRVLADPDAFDLPQRGDQQLAFLNAVIGAVRSRTTQQRWDAGWTVLAKAVAAGVPDVAARAATDLAVLREPDWPVPASIDAFVEVLTLSGALAGDR